MISPTHTKLIAEAGPMPVLSILLPSRFDLRSPVVSDSLSLLSAYIFVVARTSSQAINHIILPVFNCNIAERRGPRGSCCRCAFVAQRTRFQSNLLLLLHRFPTLSQNGCQRIEIRPSCGIRQLLAMSSTIRSRSRTGQSQ